MIFQRLKPRLICLTLAVVLSEGCISVNLAPKTFQSAEKVSFVAPSKPFKELASHGSDKTWRNSQTGNTITYVSECGNLGRMNLKKTARSLMMAQGLEVISQTEVPFKSTTAVESLGRQKDSAVTVKVELLTFLIDNCLFNLAYLGNEKNFKADHSSFRTFLENFGPL